MSVVSLRPDDFARLALLLLNYPPHALATMRTDSSSDSLTISDSSSEDYILEDDQEAVAAASAPLQFRRTPVRATARRNAEEERLRHAVGGGLVASMKAGPRLEAPPSRRRAYVLFGLALVLLFWLNGAWWTRTSAKVARAGGWSNVLRLRREDGDGRAEL